MSMPALTGSGPRRPARAGRSGWLHLCNGLDPKRDGGMVPSILGFAGGLAGHGGGVTIATPTPSRREAFRLPPRVELRGPVTDLEAEVRGAEVVHLHGLWQGHTRRGALAARPAGGGGPSAPRPAAQPPAR